jgi:SAM-dependent methyltransferase
MADQYPSAVVTGVDLSPIQPAFVPVNCVFEVDDVTEQWTYPPKHFDFVHIRDMFGSIPDWDDFFREVYRCTKPGGWVEVVERGMGTYADDDTLPPDHFYHKWTAAIFEAAAKMRKSFDIWKEAKDRMIAAGFVNVVEVPFKWPINGWPDDPTEKMLGRFNQFRLNEGCEGFMLRVLTSVLGVSFLTGPMYCA